MYVILDVDFKAKVTDEFDSNNGKISFIEYYKTKYNILLTEENQPLIKVKHKFDSVSIGTIYTYQTKIYNMSNVHIPMFHSRT